MPPLTTPPAQADARRISRRSALRLLSASVAAIAAGCSRPREEIVGDKSMPYVHMPEGMVVGVVQHYATALPLAGYGRGVIVTAVEGRPIKIEGNPRHPASLGATDVFAEAEILSLYDPDRSQAIRLHGEINDWPAFLTALQARQKRHLSDQGASLRLLTGRVGSPTMLDQIAGLKARYPAMRWHVHEPTEDDGAAAARLAFGKPFSVRPRLAEVDVILALDSDFLGPGPDQIAFAHNFAERRRRDRVAARLYVAESVPSLTGANADHRLAAHPADLAKMTLALSRDLTGAGAAADAKIDQTSARFLSAVAKDLLAARGRAVVLVGPSQPAAVRALGHWINDRIGAPVDVLPIDAQREEARSLAELADDLRSGKVETLIIVDSNPAETAPGDIAFEPLLAKAEFSAHLGAYFDETAAACAWHVPMVHALESWSDLAAPNGAISIVQPLIRPLHGGYSGHRLLGAVAGETDQSDYDRVRQTWRNRWGDSDFEARWRQALHDGVAATPPAASTVAASALPPTIETPPTNGLTLVFRPDPSVFDGRFANNAWLQECPQPLTKAVWGNAICLAPADAARLGIKTEDEIKLSVAERSVTGPARVMAGQAPGVIALTLGGGRRRVGAIGEGVGVNAAILRKAGSPWLTEQVTLAATGQRRVLPSTAFLFALGGEASELAPETDIGTSFVRPKSENRPSFNPRPAQPPMGDPYAWAMVIDTGACIGCNACVIACQSENNVPVVGPAEIAVGRDMHWLRIDLYNHGSGEQPRPLFQPVPCMQCERAPCEPVCPVEASVHDHEGLNVQVYNRCIGTRFCEANCPYKVRRFNFFGYADGQELGNLGDPLVKAANNPDVTVRARGVMEKCTYCVQRISGARRLAEREKRTIADGEVVTACQAACPTGAIHFGNLADPNSEVARLRQSPNHYALLEKLDTRPRTTYLAKQRNPNPAIEVEKA